MCWLFCYSFLIILDTTIHHISNESEDMYLLKHICNYNFMQLHGSHRLGKTFVPQGQGKVREF